MRSLNLLRFDSPAVSRFFASFRLLFKFLVAVSVTWAVSEYSSEIRDLFHRQKYVAVFKTDGTDHINRSKNFLDGFDKAKLNLHEKITIKEIPVFNDAGFLEQTTRDVVRDNDCVLIISTLTSEQSWVMLRTILQYPNIERPALVLATSTSDRLYDVAAQSDYKAILGLLPKNTAEAEVIYGFLKEGHYKKVALFRGVDNSEYSRNLSNDIEDMITADISSAQPKQDGIKIVFKGDYSDFRDLPTWLLELTRGDTSSPAELAALLRPDIVIFSGVESNGYTFIEQIYSYKLPYKVLFSEGVATDRFMRMSRNIVDHLCDHAPPCESEHLFVTTLRDDSCDRSANKKDFYELIGEDAAIMVATMAESLKHQGRFVSVSRDTVYTYIENLRAGGEIKGTSCRYSFDLKNGSNNIMRYAISHKHTSN